MMNHLRDKQSEKVSSLKISSQEKFLSSMYNESLVRHICTLYDNANTIYSIIRTSFKPRPIKLKTWSDTIKSIKSHGLIGIVKNIISKFVEVEHGH